MDSVAEPAATASSGSNSLLKPGRTLLAEHDAFEVADANMRFTAMNKPAVATAAITGDGGFGLLPVGLLPATTAKLVVKAVG